MSDVAHRQEVQPWDNRPAPALAVLTPMDMLNKAVSQGADIVVLEKLMALQERWQANQARKSFDEAMADAKAEIPPILKNRTVDFSSAKGRTHYQHEDLAEIARTVDPILSRHGLSYRFRTRNPANEPITVTCIVSHRDGHFEENTLSGPRDESGNKNGLQGIGSTQTYLARYTLKAALGLASSNDDDGRSAGTHDDGLIESEQFGKLTALIKEVSADEAKFLAYFKIDALTDLPATQFKRAVAALEAKRGKQ